MLRDKLIPLMAVCLLWLPGIGQEITYFDDIQPILDRSCVSCHQAGEVGAMPLTTYDEVSAYGRMIQYVTSVKLMPPWYADASYRHFSNERTLSEAEIKMISDWFALGMPIGSPPKTDPEPKKPDAIGIRKPDLVISMDEAFEQYGIYLDQYQVFVLPVGLNEDAWVDGIEFIPGNKKIVRFAGISVESSDKFDSLDRWDPRYGYYSFGGLGLVPEEPFWYTWTPQQPVTHYLDGHAKLLPRESKLIVYIHYGPTGKPQKDSSSICLYFSSDKPRSRVLTAPLINPYQIGPDSLFIPANTKKTFHASYIVPYDLEIFNMTPQANLLCRSWEVYAKIPGENIPIKLLKIKDWNFNWKQTYHLEHPVLLPEGTVIHAQAQYDNTLENPCNPLNEPVNFSWGTHMFNEMFFVHFGFRALDAYASEVEMKFPPVAGDADLEVFLTFNTSKTCEILLCGPGKNDCTVIKQGEFKSGTHKVVLPSDTLPGGNYVVRVKDKSGHIIASQILIRIQETGL